MSNLVERLRAEAEGMPENYIKHQAADEIERLEIQLDNGPRCSITGNECLTDTWNLSDPPNCKCGNLIREQNELRSRLGSIRSVVAEQAEDEGLWGVPVAGTQPITEAYLQQELRRLHEAVEGVSRKECAARVIDRRCPQCKESIDSLGRCGCVSIDPACAPDKREHD